MTFRSFFALVLAMASLDASAANLKRITTDGEFGNIAFQHLELNGAGDFVGVSNSRVFAGNVQEERVEQILATTNTSFVLTASTSFQVNGAGAVTVNVDVDVLSSRLALNAAGDFVLASNTRLFVGNARTGQVREVANAGVFADFQTVEINDAGQYVALASKKIYGGRVGDDAATLLLDEAFGIFDVTELYGFNNSVSGSAADKRLALNAQGRFVAVTGSAVYAGDLGALTASEVLRQRLAGFRHVELNDAGQLVVVTDKDVFVGSVD